MNIDYEEAFHVGERVGRLMHDSGLKVEDLAFELDLSPAHLRKLLKDQFRWKREYIDRVAIIFQVSYEYVQYGIDMVETIGTKESFEERLKKDMAHILSLDHDEQMRHWANIFETAAKSFKKN